MNHRLVHAETVEGCYGCKLLTVSIAPSAQGSPKAREVNEREARWEKDLPAYRRLRKNGLQPKAIDGCADLETHASEKFEIEYGHIVPKEDAPRIKEALASVREMEV